MCFIYTIFPKNFEPQNYKLFSYEKHFQRINFQIFINIKNMWKLWMSYQWKNDVFLLL